MAYSLHEHDSRLSNLRNGVILVELLEKKAIFVDQLRETNIHDSTDVMYGKRSVFYESHKYLGYYAHAQTVSTRPLFGGSGLGTRLPKDLHIIYCRSRLSSSLSVNS